MARAVGKTFPRARTSEEHGGFKIIRFDGGMQLVPETAPTLPMSINMSA